MTQILLTKFFHLILLSYSATIIQVSCTSKKMLLEIKKFSWMGIIWIIKQVGAYFYKIFFAFYIEKEYILLLTLQLSILQP